MNDRDEPQIFLRDMLRREGWLAYANGDIELDPDVIRFLELVEH